MNAAAGYAQALWAGKLYHIDLNGQNGPKYDQDLRFGAGNVRGAFWVVDALLAGGYDGPVHFDYKPARIEDEDGVWVSAAANMRNYLILREKVRAFRADPEVQAALEAARLPELAQPTLGGRRGLAAAARVAAARPRGPRRRRRGDRAPRPARARAPLRRALTHASMTRARVHTERLRRQNVSLVLAVAAPRGSGDADRARPAHRPRQGDRRRDRGGPRGRAARWSRRSPGTGARGRPGRPVALRGDRFLALGLELNVDYVAGGGPRPDRRGAAGRDPARAAGRCRAARRRCSTLARRGTRSPATRRPRPGRRHAGRPRPGPRRQPDRRLGAQRRRSRATRWRPAARAGAGRSGLRDRGSATTPTARRTRRRTTARRPTAATCST